MVAALCRAGVPFCAHLPRETPAIGHDEGVCCVKAVRREPLVWRLALKECQARESVGEEHAGNIAAVCTEIIARVKVILESCAHNDARIRRVCGW